MADTPANVVEKANAEPAPFDRINVKPTGRLVSVIVQPGRTLHQDPTGQTPLRAGTRLDMDESEAVRLRSLGHVRYEGDPASTFGHAQMMGRPATAAKGPKDEEPDHE
jgi:hypothetical protein